METLGDLEELGVEVMSDATLENFKEDYEGR
jgi:hypothetical protein